MRILNFSVPAHLPCVNNMHYTFNLNFLILNGMVLFFGLEEIFCLMAGGFYATEFFTLGFILQR